MARLTNQTKCIGLSTPHLLFQTVMEVFESSPAAAADSLCPADTAPLLLHSVLIATDVLGHHLLNSTHEGLQGGQSSLQRRLIHQQQIICSGESTQTEWDSYFYLHKWNLDQEFYNSCECNFWRKLLLFSDLPNSHHQTIQLRVVMISNIFKWLTENGHSLSRISLFRHV